MGLIHRATNWWRARGVDSDSPQSVMGRLTLSDQIQRLGSNISPSRVSSIILSADNGEGWQLVDLGNEFRQKECHLQSVLHTRETALSGLDWRVAPYLAPGSKEPTAHHQEVADVCTRACEEAVGDGQERRGFPGLIAHLNGGPFFGHAEAETSWTVRDGLQLPTGFHCHSQRRFGFDPVDGRLVWWDQSAGRSDSSRIDVQAAYPGMFLLHQPRIVGDVPAREGLIRPLIWMALFKNWGIADWMRLAELAWKPWRLGKYKSGATDRDKANLLEALEYLTSNGVAIFNERHEIEIRSPEAGNRSQTSQHEALARFCDSAISKAALGQTLTTESGERGARSLGEVHDEIRKDLRDNDAQAIAATIRRDLIAWIVRLNYGDAEPIPWFGFITEERDDFTTFMAGVRDATDAGVDIPQEWVRDQAGIREPKPGERLVGGALYDPLAGTEDDAEDDDTSDDETDVDLEDLDE